jgi:UDP-N-acetyl-D-mannosaminuronate dehydrogenase
LICWLLIGQDCLPLKYSVVGFDINQNRIHELNASIPLLEIDEATLTKVLIALMTKPKCLL